MAKEGTRTVSYSSEYYRPQKTKVGKQGWYVDKITRIHHTFLNDEVTCEPIWFETEELAAKFARNRFGKQKLYYASQTKEQKNERND